MHIRMHIHMHIHMNIRIYLHMRAAVTAIAGGETHSMLLKTDGSLWATGYNREGQFGDGNTTKLLAFKKVVLSGQCCTKGTFTSVRV